jgi:hypothetical protein
MMHVHVQANNVEVIVERMMGYLRSSTPDEHIRRDIVRKVGVILTLCPADTFDDR